MTYNGDMKTEIVLLLLFLLFTKDENALKDLSRLLPLFKDGGGGGSDLSALLGRLFPSAETKEKETENPPKASEEKKTRPPFEGIANEDILKEMAAYLSHAR